MAPRWVDGREWSVADWLFLGGCLQGVNDEAYDVLSSPAHKHCKQSLLNQPTNRPLTCVGVVLDNVVRRPIRAHMVGGHLARMVLGHLEPGLLRVDVHPQVRGRPPHILRAPDQKLDVDHKVCMCAFCKGGECLASGGGTGVYLVAGWLLAIDDADKERAS